MTPELDLFQRLQRVGAIKPTAPSEGSVVEKELAKGDPDVGTPVTIRNLFTHHDTHPIVVDVALLKTFGAQWLGWETPTVYAEIQRAFKSQISELARAKIQTIKTVHVSSGPWEQWHVFEKIVQGLNNNIPRWDVMQAPSLEQLYAAIDMLDQLRQEEFSDEVKAYMASVALNNDVLYVPPPLEIIQEFVAQPYYVCKDCGNQDSALFHDGLCDTCLHKYDSEKGLSMRPSQELLDDGKGRNLELHLTYDPTPVEQRWHQVANASSYDVQLEENQVDVQIAKLLLARDYMNVRRRQLAEQLVSLKSWLGTS
jgi:hypothetical protein